MTYTVSFIRDSRLTVHHGLSRAVAQAFADYIARVFRIIPTITQEA